MTTCCHGDEPGVAGVKSGTVGSVCQPKTWSETVRIEGKPAVRHNDEWWMNNKNTVGKLAWIETTEPFEPTTPIQYAFLDTSKTGGSVTDASPATPSEQPAKPTKLPSVPWWARANLLPLLGLIGEAGKSLKRQNDLIKNYQPPLVGPNGKPFDPDAVKQQLMQQLGAKNELELQQKIEELKESEVDEDTPPKPNGRTDSNVSVRQRCRTEIICFDKKEGSDPRIPNKFDDQLKMQQDALNAKTPAQVLQSVPPHGGAAALRPQAAQAQRDAKNSYIERNREAFVNQYGKAAWDSYISQLNALHRLDIVAGGNPKDIFGMGDKVANQSIGPQWTADSRRGKLLRYAKEMEEKGCPMAVILAVCSNGDQNEPS